MLSIDVESHSSAELKNKIQPVLLVEKEYISTSFNSIYLMNALCCTREDTKYDGYCHDVIEKLMTAAMHVTEILIAMSSNDSFVDLGEECYRQLPTISWAMNRMLLQGVLNGKESNVSLEQLARNVSQWTLLHLPRYHSPGVDANSLALDLDQHTSLLGKSSPSIGSIPKESLQLAKEYLASYYCSCSGLCNNLKEGFGSASSCRNNPYECMCHLICNQVSPCQQNIQVPKGDMEFSNVSCFALLEDVLSTRIR
jgi:hypothetical protein